MSWLRGARQTGRGKRRKCMRPCSGCLKAAAVSQQNRAPRALRVRKWLHLALCKKTSKNWLDCVRAKFYSVPIFGKLLATFANPVASPQSKRCAARGVNFLPKLPKKTRFPSGMTNKTALFPILAHPTPLHVLTEVRNPLDKKGTRDHCWH